MGIFQALIAVFLGVAFAPALISLSSTVAFTAFPVAYGWRVTSAVAEGDNVVLSGTVHKRWECDYVAPPRAADVTGTPFKVSSRAAQPDVTWPAGALRKFGPWVVEGGVGSRIVFHMHHECWGFLDTFSELGTLDARKLPYKVEQDD